MINKLFPTVSIETFMQGFYGYGDYTGSYWFVGMEEGGGNTFDEVSRRIQIWEDAGKPELDDVADYHFKLGMPQFFQEPVILQSTWNRLIRIILASKGYEVTTNLVRQYQKDNLGRKGKETCLIELLPLPSPSTKNWLYGEHSDLPILKDRETYKTSCAPWRINHIQKRMNEYHPKAVVFYGLAYRDRWQKIANVNFYNQEADGILIGSNGETIFVITRHPVSTGTTNEYFHQVGRLIANSEYSPDYLVSKNEKPITVD